jgi:YD repeat-containing protein
MASYTSGNGIVTTIGYDDSHQRYWPHQITAGNVLSLAYNYDNVGNVTGIGGAPSGAQSFDYDALDRLTQAVGPWGTDTYHYDAVGNRDWKENPYRTTYSTSGNRLVAATGAEPEGFGYDNAGNLIGDGLGSYTYTPFDMMRTSTISGQLWTYRYDADHLRVVSIGTGVKRYSLRGLANLVLTEVKEEGGLQTWVMDYIYAGTRLVAGVRPASGTWTLTVQKAGAGTGTVTSAPSNINCGPTCSAAWPGGTIVTLTAAPDPGWAFAGWSGDADCEDGVVTLTSAKTCVATFPAFTKRTPASGTAGLGSNVTLTWSPVAGATYQVCVDTTDDRACATGWQAAGAAATLTVGGLASQTTYFWQVRTVGSPSQEADVGTWSSFTVDQPAPRRQWYLAEGTTVWAFGFQEDLLVFNPSAAATHVDIQYLKPNGTVVLQDFDLGAKTRRTVRVNTVVQGTDVAAVVESSTADVVVERTMTWSSGRGGHHGVGVTAPALDWYLAEGTSYGDFATYVTIANPGTAATDVQVTFTPDTGTAVTQTYTVGAQSRLTVYANGVIGAGRNFWTRVHSLGAGVVVERSMYWGSNFEGGHETAASPVRAPEWRFAEGATGTGSGFTTYLVIANPDPTATAAVQVRFVKGDGTTVTQSYQVPPLTRQTILVNDIPGLSWAPGFSTIVRSVNGVGVVAERATYWGSWVEGHVTVGAPARSAAWWCGEGRQGTQDGLTYDTYVPLLNEDPEQALTVRAEFALETGTTIVRTYMVQPGQRFTIWTGDVAELVGETFAVTLEGTTADGVTPLAFVAERVTYWGEGWYGGHGSLGVARR